MRLFARIPLALAAVALLAAPALAAQTEVVVDNDLFGVRGAGAPPPDWDYTHGTRVRWPARGGGAARLLGGSACGRESTASDCASARWEAGQRIYTPRTDAEQPVPGERPYAGWLYGAWEGARVQGHARTHARVEAGITGAASLAGTVQTTLHRLAGYRSVGWDDQLRFEPAASVWLGREYRARRELTRIVSVEVAPELRAGAGTLWTGATAGVRTRAGLGAGDSWTGRGARRGWSGWVQAGVSGDAVFRDLTLDGNTFRDGVRVARRPWVAQGEAAAAVRRGRTELEYRHVVRGREYRGRNGLPEPHPWGSIRLRIW